MNRFELHDFTTATPQALQQLCENASQLALAYGRQWGGSPMPDEAGNVAILDRYYTVTGHARRIRAIHPEAVRRLGIVRDFDIDLRGDVIYGAKREIFDVTNCSVMIGQTLPPQIDRNGFFGRAFSLTPTNFGCLGEVNIMQDSMPDETAEEWQATRDWEDVTGVLSIDTTECALLTDVIKHWSGYLQRHSALATRRLPALRFAQPDE